MFNREKNISPIVKVLTELGFCRILQFVQDRKCLGVNPKAGFLLDRLITFKYSLHGGMIRISPMPFRNHTDKLREFFPLKNGSAFFHKLRFQQSYRFFQFLVNTGMVLCQFCQCLLKFRLLLTQEHFVALCLDIYPLRIGIICFRRVNHHCPVPQTVKIQFPRRNGKKVFAQQVPLGHLPEIVYLLFVLINFL